MRSLVIIGPDKLIKLIIIYPASTGRNFVEVLRVVDSLQLTAEYGVATPADWTQGEKVIVVPSISTEQAIEKFAKGVEVVKPYLRYTPQPLPSESGVRSQESGVPTSEVYNTDHLRQCVGALGGWN